MGAQQSHAHDAAAASNAIPQVLLLHIAHSFLSDRRTVTAAVTSHFIHHSLRSYRVKSAQSLWSIIDSPPPLSENGAIMGATVVSASRGSGSLRRVEFSPWRIGRVQRVFTTNHDYNGLQRLHELPTSVKSLEFESSPFDNQEQADVWKGVVSPPSTVIIFPPSITELSGLHFSSPLEFSKCVLPPQLVSVEFRAYSPKSSHCQVTSRLVWPESVTKLSGIWTDDLTDFNAWTLPPNLRTLHFGTGFNLPLHGIVLPDSITDLHLGCSFGHSLEGVRLPSRLTQLYWFRNNGSMRNIVWPAGLTSISWGMWDAVEIETLPDSLTELYLSDFRVTYSHQRFPRSLTKLYLSHAKVNHPFDDPNIFPDCLTELHFSASFNQDLTKVHLPSQLRTLVLGNEFNQPIDGDILPHSLTILKFGDSFNHPMSAVQLPPSLTELRFGRKFNSSVAGMKLPNGLVHLKFGEDFDQCIDELILPSTLTRFYFCGVFNQSINAVKLPESLTELSFDRPHPNGRRRFYKGSLFNRSLVNVKLPSHSYNQSLVGVTFPSTLTYLNLGRAYNQPLNNVIFPHLRQLKLGDAFNQSLVGADLPSSIIRIKFGDAFNQSLVGVDLPSSLTRLRFDGAYNQSLTGVHFPSSLTRFTFTPKLYTHSLTDWQLPPSCRELSLTIRPPFSEVHIPDHIERLHLTVFDNATKEKNILQHGIKVTDAALEAGAVTSLSGLRFPSSLRHLTFARDLTLSLEGSIWSDAENPNSSLKIKFQNFTLPILAHHLPESCTDLHLGTNWNLGLDQLVLPPRLKRLSTGEKFNQCIDDWVLPSSLEVLAFGGEFNHPIHHIELPASIHSILFNQEGGWGPYWESVFQSAHFIKFIQYGALAHTSIHHRGARSQVIPLTLPPP